MNRLSKQPVHSMSVYRAKCYSKQEGFRYGIRASDFSTEESHCQTVISTLCSTEALRGLSGWLGIQNYHYCLKQRSSIFNLFGRGGSRCPSILQVVQLKPQNMMVYGLGHIQVLVTQPA